ncbi:MAG: hypothetical protein A2W80_02115 [Candidatus Riflebacteria bacterium GWC2_50_8]|nr:MAG: hypothetical protein A2W80_02115 [Candidatus Riflebacteria bacterium GWC2_50_8]
MGLYCVGVRVIIGGMLKLKYFLIVLVALVGTLLVGCSVPGSPNTPVIDESVTISGTVSVPTVTNPGLLAAVGLINNPDAFARFVASSTLKVNGRAVEFSLNDSTRAFRAEKIVPAAAYELELRCGDFSLIAFAPHSVREITLSNGLSLRSTAEWYLRAAFGGAQNFSTSQFADYQVSSTLVDSLAISLQTELNKTGLASAAWRLAASNSASAMVADRSLTEVLQRTGRVFSYNGNYAATVFYSRLNSSGVPVMAVQAAVTMTCTTSADNVSGSFSIEPIAVKPIDDFPITSTPSKTSFAFTGKLNGSYLSFTRKAANDGSPLANKDLDSWFIFPVNDGIAVQASNLDQAYYTGIQTRAGEFILRKK